MELRGRYQAIPKAKTITDHLTCPLPELHGSVPFNPLVARKLVGLASRGGQLYEGAVPAVRWEKQVGLLVETDEP